jgi:hypothetical protein
MTIKEVHIIRIIRPQQKAERVLACTVTDLRYAMYPDGLYTHPNGWTSFSSWNT